MVPIKSRSLQVLRLWHGIKFANLDGLIQEQEDEQREKVREIMRGGGSSFGHGHMLAAMRKEGGSSLLLRLEDPKVLT
jgi:hypothetical protein